MPVKRGNRKRKASAAGIAVAAKPALLPKAKKAKKDRYKRQARESVRGNLFWKQADQALSGRCLPAVQVHTARAPFLAG